MKSIIFGALLAKSPLLVFPLVALAMFLVSFLLVVLRAYAMRAAVVDAIAQLPLADDERSRPSAKGGV